jgi:hypothetical protein
LSTIEDRIDDTIRNTETMNRKMPIDANIAWMLKVNQTMK